AGVRTRRGSAVRLRPYRAPRLRRHRIHPAGAPVVRHHLRGDAQPAGDGRARDRGLSLRLPDRARGPYLVAAGECAVNRGARRTSLTDNGSSWVTWTSPECATSCLTGE